VSKSYNEEALNLAIKHAGHDIFKEIGSEASINPDTEYNFSDEFEKKMQRLIVREKRKRVTGKALKILGRVAAALLILLVVSTVVIFSSEALRLEFINIFFHQEKVSTNIDFSKTDTTEIPEGVVVPSYIPEGYRLKEIQNIGEQKTSIYENQSGDLFRINQYKDSASVKIDNEGEKLNEVDLYGTKALVTEGKVNKIVFSKDKYIFMIEGKIEVSEIIKIAESIIK
jgi:hypothetical protein